MVTKQIIKDGVLIAEVSFNEEPTTLQWIQIYKSYVPDAKPMEEIIRTKLESFQSKAQKIAIAFYTKNTLMGITKAQSRQMFKDYAHVLLMVREGAFPSAVEELQNMTPMGFCTQQMQDEWVDIILREMA